MDDFLIVFFSTIIPQWLTYLLVFQKEYAINDVISTNCDGKFDGFLSRLLVNKAWVCQKCHLLNSIKNLNSKTIGDSSNFYKKPQQKCKLCCGHKN